VELNGEHDHVHLLVNYPPKVDVSDLFNSVKCVPSAMNRKENYLRIHKNPGAAPCLSRAILPEVVAVRRFKGFGRKPSSNKQPADN